MKASTWLGWVGLLALVVGVGCKVDKVVEPPLQPGRGYVQIAMNADTLFFLPGDSATADGYVIVMADNMQPAAGIYVNLSLLIPVGHLELPDTVLKDTTDQNGRVHFRYCSFNQTGETQIRAAVGNVVDIKHIWIRQREDMVAQLQLDLSRTTLQVSPGQEDSVTVTVTVSDSLFQPVRGLNLPLRANGGRLRPIGTTDSLGTAHTTWYSNGQYGEYTISLRVGHLYAEGTVRVDSLR